MRFLSPIVLGFLVQSIDLAAARSKALIELATVLGKFLNYKPWLLMDLLKRADQTELVEVMVSVLGPVQPPCIQVAPEQFGFDFIGDDRR